MPETAHYIVRWKETDGIDCLWLVGPFPDDTHLRRIRRDLFNMGVSWYAMPVVTLPADLVAGALRVEAP